MNLNWYLCFPERLRCRCENLAAYTERLSGIRPILVEITKEKELELLAAVPAEVMSSNAQGNIPYASFRLVADMAGKEPFGWLEHDSIPLTPDWHKKLAEAYTEARKKGKRYLLPHVAGWPDHASGIGIYPEDVALPEYFPVHSWDWWIYTYRKDEIEFTDLIQHSYGVYGNGRPWPKPRGHKFYGIPSIAVSERAVLFHRDPEQHLVSVIGARLGYSGVACP